MRKIPYKTWLCAGIFLLYPWVAHAAGLGRLTVLSALGQPLSAEIELVSVQKDELTSLSARVASPEAFQQANIQYSPALIGIRLTVERHADGKPYIKVISTRPVNEPFLAVLVELSWAQGRLLREYTALIDPPGYTATAPAAAVPAPIAPPAASEAKPIAPPPAAAVEPAPRAPAGKAAASPRPAAPAKAESSEYAVKRGDTLARIAATVKPEGVTLDQMLISLYRNNTDAFAGNMNRLKTGRILRVPDKESVAGTAPAEATKEVRVQSSNWNAYRLKLAEGAGAAPAQESTKSAASGKITAAEDKGATKDAPKEVLKLSKGDTSVSGKAGSGKAMSAKDRTRMLEEEAIAREKALAEANARVAQLEKNIKDMQRLLEIKGVVPPGAKPVAPAPPAPPAKADQVAKADPTKALPPPPPPAKAEPAKAEAAKAEPAKDATRAEPPKAEQKAAPPVVESPKAEAPKGEAPKADAAKAEAPKVEPKPKPKPVPAPPPVVEPGMVDQIISAATDPIYLAGALGGLAVLGAGAFWFARRRRAQDGGGAPREVKAEKTAPKLAPAAAAGAAMAASPMITPPAAGGDDVDPLAEADLYLNFGRDAQAEEVLKEALAKNPQHEEAELKLLQIYAARKDKTEFEKIASQLHTQTAGVGDNWLKAAGMGYAFDPENPLYEAGKSAPAAAASVAAGAAAGTDLDFDLELAPGANNVIATDVPLDSGEKTMMMRPGELAGMSAAPDDGTATHDITHDSAARAALAESAASPDFTLNVPAGSGPASMTDITIGPGGADQTATNVTGDSAAGPMVSAIDFNFDAPAAEPAKPANAPQPFNHDSTVIISPENQDKPADLAMDFDVGSLVLPETAAPVDSTAVTPLDTEFKLDLGGDATLSPTSAAAAPAIPDLKLDDISLNLDDAPKMEGGAKDDHWYDVQTKFDLAKAYQEMGDKDGAREILQEVIKEGDAAQQSEAKQLLDTLG